MTDPSWQPDPTGRNHYRWWDGSQWTDSVSTDGVVSLDPVHAPAPQAQVPVIHEQTPVAPAVPQAPVAQTTPIPPTPQVPTAGEVPQFTPVVAEASKKKSSALKWIIPIVAVAAVGAGLFFFLGGNDDDDAGGGGLGVTEGEITEDEPAVFATVKLKAGDSIRMRAEPERRLDIKLVIFADQDTADAWAEAFIATGEGEDDFFTDADELADLLFTDGDELVSDGDLADQVALFVVDEESEGDFEADFFPVLADGTYTVAAVASEQGDEGEVRLIVEKSPETFDPDDNFSDIDEFFSDSDLFVSDDPFFTDDDPFEPES